MFVALFAVPTDDSVVIPPETVQNNLDGTFVAWVVTSDVQAFQSGPANNGWLIKDSNETPVSSKSKVKYAPKDVLFNEGDNVYCDEQVLTSNFPQLVIDWVLPTATPTRTNTPVPTQVVVEERQIHVGLGGPGVVSAVVEAAQAAERNRAATPAATTAAAVSPPRTSTGITPPNTGDAGLKATELPLVTIVGSAISLTVGAWLLVKRRATAG